MGLLELCEKYYQTNNLYDVLQISETSTDKEVKKAYHKLSLKVHPDRVPEDQKLEATEKFKVLGGVHAVLSDKEKRAVYDETKLIDDDDCSIDLDRDWSAYWRFLFKKITEEDIKAYEKKYIGSDEEKKDLKAAYLIWKGDMDKIVDHVQFARFEHEPRIKGILNDMIKSGDIPAYKAFTHEAVKKQQRRAAKENREAKEAEEFKNEMGLGSEPNSLELLIKQRQESRAQKMDSFFDDLAAKYGGDNKSQGTKRKSARNAETTTKNKRRK